MSSRILNGKDIELTRGDSLNLAYELVHENGDPYEYTEGDVCRFAMKKKIMDSQEEPVTIDLTYDQESKQWFLYISPEFTKSYPMKSTFDYDIELAYTDPDSGRKEVDTFISEGKFKILPEVV